MEQDYLKVANDPLLWLVVIPAVIMVGIQAFLFSKRAFKASEVTRLSKKDCKTAFRVGAVSAIGPSLSVFVVMVAMMAVIGGPITWLRLSFIGAAPTELTAATIGAKAMGVEFGSAEYGITEFASSVWTMTLNGCGWLIFCGLFTHKLDNLQDKVAGGDPGLMAEICGAAVLGTASYLVISNSVKNINGVNKFAVDMFSAAVASAIVMAILHRFSDRMPKLKEYNLGISMIVGMIVGVLV